MDFSIFLRVILQCNSLYRTVCFANFEGILGFSVPLNHHSGPLRKHVFTFTNWKGHGLWFVISGVQSVLFVSCFSYQLRKCASQIFPIFLILVACNNKATSLFFLGQKIYSPLHAWYFLFFFVINFLLFRITLHYITISIHELLNSTCTDKHQPVLQITNTKRRHTT